MHFADGFLSQFEKGSGLELDLAYHVCLNLPSECLKVNLFLLTSI